MKKLGLILRILIIITATIQFFPWYYISELMLSFSPYWTGLLLIGVIIAFVKLRKYFKERWKNPNISHRLGLAWGFVLICIGILFMSYSKQFNSFYNYIPENQNIVWEVQNLTWIKVLYGNIHKDNTNYTAIQSMIEQADPDVVLFVEFSDNHYANLKDFLQKNYPYINSTTRSEKFIGSMVFSKYPIENRADDFEQWARRYAFFSLQLPQEESYYIYLLHTSSPDSYEHFVMRNKQLTTFLQDIQKHQIWHRKTNDQVIVLGDFNISPRSSYYEKFEIWLGEEFLNVTKTLPYLFTWKLQYLPILWTHIDHIWSNAPDKIDDIKSIKIPNSDHKWLMFELKTNNEK